VHAGFTARSAISTGLWTLCEGRKAAGRCQTVNGAAAHLKLEPKIVRPGVDAVALYDKPGLRGRRVIYSFASDLPPPFRPRSARTWGGPWSLCASGARGCEVVDGVRPNLDLDVVAVRSGRAAIPIAMTGPAPASAHPARPSPPARPSSLAWARNERTARSPTATRTPPPSPALARLAKPTVRARPPSIALARNERTDSHSASTGALPPLPTALPRSVEPLAADARRAAPSDQAASPRASSSVAYVCEDGRFLTVQFDPRNATAVVRTEDEAPVVLARTSTRLGFRYEAWDRAFYGERSQASYQVRDDDPVNCWPTPARERRRAGRPAADLEGPPPDFP
jgi:membrane-bound inhibitor of C-type lysozyme